MFCMREARGVVVCTIIAALFLVGIYPVGAQSPPIADAGGPYVGYECNVLYFDASRSFDPDHDALQYRWDFNGDGVFDTSWLSEPDALYQWLDDFTGTCQVQVSDGQSISDATAAVRIMNVYPVIESITGPAYPVEVGSEVYIFVSFFDGDDRSGVLSADSFQAVFTWSDGTQTTYQVPSGVQTVTGTHVYSDPGVYPVFVEITDDDNGSCSGSYYYVVVFEPNPLPGTGFVTGGGWILSPPGAYRLNLTLTGQANFGFNAKYHKGKQIPSGETEFNLHVASLNFHSTDYEWLIVTGNRARYKGNGTINGDGDYAFMLTGVDNGNRGDQFRIKIWDKAIGTLIYDNNQDQIIDGGQIVVHQ